VLAHLIAFVLAGLPCFAVAWWVALRANDRAGAVMIGLLICCGLWPTSVAIQILVPSATWQWAWFTVAHLVLHVGMSLWLIFALLYTGRDHWLSRPVLGVIVGVGSLSIIARITNPRHRLLWDEYQLISEPFVHLLATPGPLFWIRSLPLYVGLFIGIGAVAHMYLRSRHLTRAQSVSFFVLGLCLFVISLLRYLLPLPAAGLEYTALGSFVFGGFVAWTLLYSRLFVVAPLARDVALESITDGIVVLDDSRQIVDYNEAAQSLLPTIESETGVAFETAYLTLARTEATTDRATVTYENRQLTVSETPVERAGQLHGYTLLVRDVTELEAYASQLEDKTERLDQFASMLSHDLRSPISIARGYIELSQETGDTSHLDRSVAALERIDETIEVLLTMARHGNDAGNPQPLSLSAVAKAAWQTSETGETRLKTALESDRIVADQPRLQQLFENLFRNAVDHAASEAAADELTIRIGNLEDGFYVADTGPGIPPEDREDVFEYGYSTSDGGTGFGLAIVDSIVDAHGWSISVTDGATGGARFEIRNVELCEPETEASSVVDLEADGG